MIVETIPQPAPKPEPTALSIVWEDLCTYLRIEAKFGETPEKRDAAKRVAEAIHVRSAEILRQASA